MVNLLEDLQQQFGLAYVFIAHDLSVVRHISDRVGVMYLGKMVEIGDEDQIYSRRPTPTPRPCCRPCRCPIPTLRNTREQIVLTGDVPSPANPPTGLPVPHPVLEGPGDLHRRRALARFSAPTVNSVTPRPATSPSPKSSILTDRLPHTAMAPVGIIFPPAKQLAP